MNHKHKPILEKLIKNASELLKIKPDMHLSYPLSTTNLTFIRKCERHYPNELNPLITPRHKKNASHRVNRLSYSPVKLDSQIKFSPDSKNKRWDRIHVLIDSIEGLQLENRVKKNKAHTRIGGSTGVINLEQEQKQVKILSHFKRRVCRITNSSM